MQRTVTLWGPRCRGRGQGAHSCSNTESRRSPCSLPPLPSVRLKPRALQLLCARVCARTCVFAYVLCAHLHVCERVCACFVGRVCGCAANYCYNVSVLAAMFQFQLHRSSSIAGALVSEEGTPTPKPHHPQLSRQCVISFSISLFMSLES